MNITEIRRKNINLGRLKSNATNRLKGLRTFVKKRSKISSLNNEIIDDLIKSNYYSYIYNIFNKHIDDHHIDINKIDLENLKIDDLVFKDIDLLLYFDFCCPSELKDKYDGIFIEEIPINF